MGLFGLDHIFFKITEKIFTSETRYMYIIKWTKRFHSIGKVQQTTHIAKKNSFYHKLLQNFPQIHTATLHIFKAHAHISFVRRTLMDTGNKENFDTEDLSAFNVTPLAW